MSENVEIYLAKDPFCDRCPIYTAITLFVHKFCQLRFVKIHLVVNTKQKAVVDMDCHGLLSVDGYIDVLSAEQIPPVVQYCDLPVALCNQGGLVIAGLSAVLRLIVSLARQSHESLAPPSSDVICGLLGPRFNCLKACAEVSPWTTYCEMTVPDLIEKVLTETVKVTEFDELAQLEVYLVESAALKDRQRRTTGRQPSVTRQVDIQSQLASTQNSDDNFSIKMPDDQKIVPGLLDLVTSTSCKSIASDSPFVEGDFLQLTDLVLFVCFSLGVNKSSVLQQSLGSHCRVSKWYQTVSSLRCVREAMAAIGLSNLVLIPFDQEHQLSLSVNTGMGQLNLNQDTLQNKAKPRLVNSFQTEIKSKFKASQFAITSVLQKLKEACLVPLTVDLNCSAVRLPWSDYPNNVLPSTVIGGVPDKRADRKLEQLENMAAAVLKIVQLHHQESCIIVDFCSGGGHLGILLAFLLPHCKVVLVENKVQSLNRALARCNALELSNVTAVQCNLNCFQMSFDIGVSLHACGVVTDLVIKKCVETAASFVVCPCCYGAVRNNHLVQYPRSNQYIAAGVSYADYLVLGHAADQTQSSTPKEGQGHSCMTYIDSDRVRAAVELGYHVTLCRMTPPSCSPKNHIITGLKRILSDTRKVKDITL